MLFIFDVIKQKSLFEFQEKRKEREVQQMFDMLEMVTEIKETQIEKAVKLGDMHLCNLTANCKLVILHEHWLINAKTHFMKWTPKIFFHTKLASNKKIDHCQENVLIKTEYALFYVI